MLDSLISSVCLPHLVLHQVTPQRHDAIPQSDRGCDPDVVEREHCTLLRTVGKYCSIAWPIICSILATGH